MIGMGDATGFASTMSFVVIWHIYFFG